MPAAAARRTRIAVFGAVQALALCAAASANAECLIYRNWIQLGTQLSVQMMAPSGQDCRVRLPLDDETVIDVNRITARPNYGGVRVDGFSGVSYRSNPGYKGPDRFSYEFCGQKDEKTVCTKVNVKVDVR